PLGGLPIPPQPPGPSPQTPWPPKPPWAGRMAGVFGLEVPGRPAVWRPILAGSGLHRCRYRRRLAGMGKASRTKYDIDRRQKIAAQREAARHAQTRNRLLLASGAIIAVVAVAISLVLVRPGSSTATKTPPADGPTGTALANTVRDLTTVPAGVLDAVGAGSLVSGDIGSPTAVGGGYLTPGTRSPLTKDGKPEVLYVGADFCPYCAAARWPLIVALSRFGTFSGLTPARSGVTTGSGQAEPYPATPTWTFHGSSYTSPYLAFSPVETHASVPDPKTGGYTALQTPTAAQQQTMARYDPQNRIPFVTIGN